MKFLSVDQLELLTGFLTGREVGDRILNGRIEAFSCKLSLSPPPPLSILTNSVQHPYRAAGLPGKRAGEDKKLSKVLEQQVSPTRCCSPDTRRQQD